MQEKSFYQIDFYSRNADKATHTESCIEYFGGEYNKNVSNYSAMRQDKPDQDAAEYRISDVYSHRVQLFTESLQHTVSDVIEIHDGNKRRHCCDIFRRFGTAVKAIAEWP
jgi:hypothetical protein